MASRPNIAPFVSILNGDMSGNIIGKISNIGDLYAIGYSFSWVGTSPVGTVSIQVSSDYKLSQDGQTVLNAGTWNTLTLNYQGTAVTSIPVTGNTGNGFVDLTATSATWVKPIYTFTSGVGSLQAIFNAKVT